MTLDDWGRKAAGLVLKHSVAQGTVDRLKKRLRQANKDRVCAEKAQVILQDVAKTVQQKAHEQIAGVVSRCIAAVFEDPYTFHVSFERRRGRTEADLYFMRDGNRFNMNQVGGGVVDIAAFALRLSCLILTRPALRRVLILDEPFKNVNGEDNRRRARALMETLPKELGIQVIMSTGYPWLEIGAIVQIDDG